MKRLASAAAIFFSITLTALSWVQDPIGQDNNLSKDQKKYLKQFQADLEKRPVNPNASDQYVAKVQGSLKQLFAVNNKPSGQCTDTLANTLFRGLNNGQVSVQTSVLLAKEISKALGATEITYNNVNAFTKAIDPLVQQTTLGPTEKLRLYREAVIILKTVPNYVPEQP